MAFLPQEDEMFKKILVPLDGSELAAKILPQVGDLAKLAQGQVILMSVGSTRIGPADEVVVRKPCCRRGSDQSAGGEVSGGNRRGAPAQGLQVYLGL